MPALKSCSCYVSDSSVQKFMAKGKWTPNQQTHMWLFPELMQKKDAHNCSGYLCIL